MKINPILNFESSVKDVGLNLRKFWKVNPFFMANLAFYKESFIYQEADFAAHVGGIFLQGLL